MIKSMRRFAFVLSVVFAFVAAGCATQGTTVGTKIDDTAITTKVKAALLADPDVSGQKVSVETVAGVVQLSGFVPSTASAARAADIARRVDGVRRVENKISIRGS
jgi:hyperosmotically inducible periplasmic protein